MKHNFEPTEPSGFSPMSPEVLTETVRWRWWWNHGGGGGSCSEPAFMDEDDSTASYPGYGWEYDVVPVVPVVPVMKHDEERMRYSGA
jgi:hypothetical protein